MVRGASDIVAFAGAAWLGSLCLAAQACDLPPPETGTVAAARDGETLQLSDGRIVRLIGAKAPMPPLGWRGDDPWPLVEEAKAALSLLAAGKAVELRFGGPAPTGTAMRSLRCSWSRASAVSGSSSSLSPKASPGSIPSPTTGPASASCWRARARGEGQAARRVGVLRLSHRTGARREASGAPDPFLPAGRGTVAAVGEGGGRLYLNFAPDWRSDFTISVERKDASAFAAAGIDLKKLAGTRLRARGFLAWRNGPMIEASHPEQIELLPASPHQKAQPPPQPGPAIAL